MNPRNPTLMETRRIFINGDSVCMTIAKKIAEEAKIEEGVVVMQELQSDGTILIRPVGGIRK